METFLATETLIIGLLLVVALVAIAVRRLRIPYTVALVLVGLVLAIRQPLELSLTPELILTVFVPPLVFEAAFHLNLNDLRRDWLTVALLAGPGVLLTVLIVGGLLILTTPVRPALALVFGALIAATDPVAVVSLFRRISVPRRLATLVESESLFNDGTAIVIFNLALVVALTGRFNLFMSIGEFLRVSAGGILIGLALGWLISALITRVDDYLIETTLTTVLAFGSYLLADRLQVSGVLAVVAAGLVNGNIGPKGMSPTTRIVVANFWEYVAFLANSMVFLLIGIQLDVSSITAAWQPILLAIVGVLVARTVVVYGFSFLSGRLGDGIPIRWKHVLAWGGLRGAISLALALSLPASLGDDRFLLQTVAFGVVLFTLLVQGTTMDPLIKRLRIVTRPPAYEEYEVRHARLVAARAAAKHLDQMHREGLLSTSAWETIHPRLEEEISELVGQVRAVLKEQPHLEAEELDTARREILRAERSALLGLRRDRVISDDVYERLAAEVDFNLTEAGDALDETTQEYTPPRKI